ncbi:hypothetical protein [Limnobacter sp.]|uniref:hypothetical protein n=1 Tax=Limnobacter sp. TaxID=2003368 RepID=UPI00311F1AF8
MKKFLVFGALALLLCVPARAIAPVVAIGTAKVIASTGASVSINAAVNLVGIAVSAIVFGTIASGDNSYTFNTPTNAVIPSSPITSVVVGNIPQLPEGARCARFYNDYYNPSSKGNMCTPVTTSGMVSGSFASGNCIEIPAPQFLTHSCDGENPGKKRVYHLRVEGSNIGYVRTDFSTSYESEFSSTTPTGTLQVDLTENGYTPRTSDADYSAAAGGNSSTPAYDSGTAYIQYQSSSGEFNVAKLDPQADGSLSITEYTQISTGQVRQTNMNIDSGGVAQSHSQNYYQGEVAGIPQTSTGQISGYVPVQNAQQNPAPDGSTNPGSGGEIQFPTDYARTGEAAQAALTVSSAVESLVQGEVLTPTVEDESMPWFGSTFDGVLPTINTSGATCPVWQFDALGESFYIDHHCQLIVDFNALFYAMFTAFWVLLAFRTVLEA